MALHPCQDIVPLHKQLVGNIHIGHFRCFQLYGLDGIQLVLKVCFEIIGNVTHIHGRIFRCGRPHVLPPFDIRKIFVLKNDQVGFSRLRQVLIVMTYNTAGVVCRCHLYDGPGRNIEGNLLQVDDGVFVLQVCIESQAGLFGGSQFCSQSFRIKLLLAAHGHRLHVHQSLVIDTRLNIYPGSDDDSIRAVNFRSIRYREPIRYQ